MEEWSEPTFKKCSNTKKKSNVVLSIIFEKLINIFLISGIEAVYQAFTKGYFVLGRALIYWLLIEFVIHEINDFKGKVGK